MWTATLGGPVDFEGFRNAARRFAAHGIPPEEVVWRTADDEGDLFARRAALPPPLAAEREVTVPRAFVPLAEAVICHSDPHRLALLYRILCRLRSEPRLLEIATDPDVSAARRMEKAVGRDVHKMHAFVRFRTLQAPEGERMVAWFEPEHFIEERAAGFFVRRFAPMPFAILTPRVTLAWDTRALTVGPPGSRADWPAEDAAEELWLTYFSSIFNPARLKVKAMTAEMPRKYWRNLPEAALIPSLIEGAAKRVTAMMAAEPTRAPAFHDRIRARAGQEAEEMTIADDETLDRVRAEASACRRCPLFADATQTVFGEGPGDAPLLFVGEQPGDREDIAGRPFVGPAGQLFDEAILEAGIDRTACYVTNAVKHFKYEPRGKRRIHKKPNAAEIEACRWWLAMEIRLVQPRLVVGLGGTALQSLLDRPVKITEIRGRFMDFRDGLTLFATVHPSYLLRIPDAAARDTERRRFVDDLKRVAERMAA